MARPKAFDKDQALDAAIGVFREHGFEGSSAEKLLAAMKIGRQSLYDTFGDKWGLYRSAVERYCQAETGAHVAALRQGPRAIDGLKAMLDRVVAEAATACLGVGSVCEFGRSRQDLNTIHVAAGTSLAAALTGRIRNAQAEGDIDAALAPDDAARFLAANIAAIRVAARGGAGPAELRTLADLAMRCLR